MDLCHLSCIVKYVVILLLLLLSFLATVMVNKDEYKSQSDRLGKIWNCLKGLRWLIFLSKKKQNAEVLRRSQKTGSCTYTITDRMTCVASFSMDLLYGIVWPSAYH